MTFLETSGARCAQLLERCGNPLPPHLKSALPIFRSAWGTGDLDTRRFALWQAGDGLVLDRARFDTWLLASSMGAGVHVLQEHRLLDGEHVGDGWRLRVVGGGGEHTMKASFVVAATGRAAASPLLRDDVRIFDDDLICAAVSVSEATRTASQETAAPETALPEAAAEALIESAPDGWWFAVRAADGRQTVALFTDADFVPPARSRGEWFVDGLRRTRHVRAVADAIPSDPRVDITDARTSVRRVFWRDRWLAIGDAAWSLDPLSGNGVERALQDGVTAAAAIDASLTSGDNEPLRAHALGRAQAFVASRNRARKYYALETRWRESRFWGRRRFRASTDLARSTVRHGGEEAAAVRL
jgi:flavin-dependent dehydrogenase